MKNEALSTFISTAESLQIKGLTDSDTPSKVPGEVLSPQLITLDAPTVTAAAAPPPPPMRPAASRPIPKRVSARAQQQIVVEKQPDSEDSGSEEVIRAPTIVAGTKRISLTAKAAAPSVKRIKMTASSTPNQSPATKQTTTLMTSKRQVEAQPPLLKTEEVMIELDHNADVEDDEEHEEQEEEAQQALTEDDTYAELKYDETYFTENDTTTETKPATTSYQAAEQSAGDISQADNQG